jgi:5S rRNA maturation endonuclease (ribonuclease M5)
MGEKRFRSPSHSSQPGKDKDMAYGICRIAKLKTAGAIAASEAHTRRQRFTPNADLTKANERFIGTTPGTAKLEQEVFERIGAQKIRKDGVLCVEILLTASPEFFRPGDRGRAGQWDSQQLADWKEANHDWLSGTFGDRIVRAELHLDESTPHIHAYLVPLDQKGKLNCKSIFGGREKLSQFQDSYAAAMQALGLERGIKGSRATHTQVKEYYAAVVKEPDQQLTAAQMHHQLVDRDRILKERAELERTAKDLARQKEALEQRLRRVQDRMEQQQLEAQKWRESYQAITGQLRQIPLDQVACELGLDPDPRDRHKWRNETQMINLTGSKFFDWKDMKGGGGAIDLVMHVEGCNFTDAVDWLRERFGAPGALQLVTQQVVETVQEKPQQPFVPPLSQEANWGQVRDYLIQKRKLPSGLVDQLHQAGLVYADERSNAVFLRRDWDGQVTGAMLRGTSGENNLFKGLATGTRRSQGWFYTIAGGVEGAPVERVVLVEGAIDGLSYQVLHPPQVRTMVLSTDGAGYLPLDQLKTAERVAIAFDGDGAGDEMARRLQAELPDAERHLPMGKDWNEDLQQRIEELQRLFLARQVQRELGQKKEDELSL